MFTDGHADGRHLAGLGSCDMKGGVAILLKLAASVPDPDVDVTYVFYDCEEVEAPQRAGPLAASNARTCWPLTSPS